MRKALLQYIQNKYPGSELATSYRTPTTRSKSALTKNSIKSLELQRVKAFLDAQNEQDRIKQLILEYMFDEPCAYSSREVQDNPQEVIQSAVQYHLLRGNQQALQHMDKAQKARNDITELSTGSIMRAYGHEVRKNLEDYREIQRIIHELRRMNATTRKDAAYTERLQSVYASDATCSRALHGTENMSQDFRKTRCEEHWPKHLRELDVACMTKNTSHECGENDASIEGGCTWVDSEKDGGQCRSTTAKDLHWYTRHPTEIVFPEFTSHDQIQTSYSVNERPDVFDLDGKPLNTIYPHTTTSDTSPEKVLLGSRCTHHEEEQCDADEACQWSSGQKTCTNKDSTLVELMEKKTKVQYISDTPALLLQDGNTFHIEQHPDLLQSLYLRWSNEPTSVKQPLIQDLQDTIEKLKNIGTIPVDYFVGQDHQKEYVFKNTVSCFAVELPTFKVSGQDGDDVLLKGAEELLEPLEVLKQSYKSIVPQDSHNPFMIFQKRFHPTAEDQDGPAGPAEAAVDAPWYIRHITRASLEDRKLLAHTHQAGNIYRYNVDPQTGDMAFQAQALHQCVYDQQQSGTRMEPLYQLEEQASPLDDGPHSSRNLQMLYQFVIKWLTRYLRRDPKMRRKVDPVATSLPKTPKYHSPLFDVSDARCMYADNRCVSARGLKWGLWHPSVKNTSKIEKLLLENVALYPEEVHLMSQKQEVRIDPQRVFDYLRSIYHNVHQRRPQNKQKSLLQSESDAASCAKGTCRISALDAISACETGNCSAQFSAGGGSPCLLLPSSHLMTSDPPAETPSSWHIVHPSPWYDEETSNPPSWMYLMQSADRTALQVTATPNNASFAAESSDVSTFFPVPQLLQLSNVAHFITLVDSLKSHHRHLPLVCGTVGPDLVAWIPMIEMDQYFVFTASSQFAPEVNDKRFIRVYVDDKKTHKLATMYQALQYLVCDYVMLRQDSYIRYKPFQEDYQAILHKMDEKDRTDNVVKDLQKRYAQVHGLEHEHENDDLKTLLYMYYNMGMKLSKPVPTPEVSYPETSYYLVYVRPKPYLSMPPYGATQEWRAQQIMLPDSDSPGIQGEFHKYTPTIAEDFCVLVEDVDGVSSTMLVAKESSSYIRKGTTRITQWVPAQDPGYVIECKRYANMNQKKDLLPNGTLELFTIVVHKKTAAEPASLSSFTITRDSIIDDVEVEGTDKNKDIQHTTHVASTPNANTYVIRNIPLPTCAPQVIDDNVTDRLGRQLTISSNGPSLLEDHTSTRPFRSTNETQKSEKTIDLAVVVTPGNMDLYTIPEQYLKYIPTT